MRDPGVSQALAMGRDEVPETGGSALRVLPKLLQGPAGGSQQELSAGRKCTFGTTGAGTARRRPVTSRGNAEVALRIPTARSSDGTRWLATLMGVYKNIVGKETYI